MCAAAKEPQMKPITAIDSNTLLKSNMGSIQPADKYRRSDEGTAQHSSGGITAVNLVIVALKAIMI